MSVTQPYKVVPEIPNGVLLTEPAPAVPVDVTPPIATPEAMNEVQITTETVEAEPIITVPIGNVDLSNTVTTNTEGNEIDNTPPKDLSNIISVRIDMN